MDDTLATDLDDVRSRVGNIPDPEIPVVTLSDLGILRKVYRDASGALVVILTPTYSGCPATEAIREDVIALLARLGHHDASVQISLSPPWTTDWIGPDAREKLRRYGIAPPGRCASHLPDDEQVVHIVPREQFNKSDPVKPSCPQCSSQQVELISEFGSTPCKALYRCLSCREPFDYFKPY